MGVNYSEAVEQNKLRGPNKLKIGAITNQSAAMELPVRVP